MKKDPKIPKGLMLLIVIAVIAIVAIILFVFSQEAYASTGEQFIEIVNTIFEVGTAII